MSIIDNAQELAALIKAKGDSDLYRMAVELEAEIIELSREKIAAEQQVADLRRHREIIDHLTFQAPFYVATGDELFCSRCIEVEQRAVHVVRTDKLELRRRVWSCPECKRSYADTRSMHA